VDVAKYYFEHLERFKTLEVTDAFELSAPAEAYSMAVKAAHEAACCMALTDPVGKVAVIVRSDLGAELARASVVWCLEVAGGAVPAPDTDGEFVQLSA
jgi:hypothetical protein